MLEKEYLNFDKAKTIEFFKSNIAVKYAAILYYLENKDVDATFNFMKEIFSKDTGKKLPGFIKKEYFKECVLDKIISEEPNSYIQRNSYQLLPFNLKEKYKTTFLKKGGEFDTIPEELVSREDAVLALSKMNGFFIDRFPNYDKWTIEDWKVFIKEKPEVAYRMPEAYWNKEVLYIWLEALVRYVKTNDTKQFCIDFKVENRIPKELKDKTYWQVMGMCGGYGIRKIPKEFRYVVNNTLINFSLEHDNSYVGALHLYESLTDEQKTEELSIVCCLKHFYCLQHLPESLRNESFYNKLYEKGMTDFSYMDILSVSTEFLEKVIKITKDSFVINHMFDKKGSKVKWSDTLIKEVASKCKEAMSIIPAKYISEDVAKIYLQQKGSDFTTIPKKYQTEDNATLFTAINPFYALREIDDTLKTDRFYDIVLGLQCLYPKDIPEDRWTDKIVDEYLEHETIDKFTDIPEKFRTKERLLKYIEKAKNGYCFSSIPKEMRTKDVARLIYEKQGLKACPSWIIQFGNDDFFKEDLEKWCAESYNVIDTLHERNLDTKELWEIAVRAFPEKILSMPKEFLEEKETKGPVSNVVPNMKPTKEEVQKKAEKEEIVEVLGQLSLFDLFPAM